LRFSLHDGISSEGYAAAGVVYSYNCPPSIPEGDGTVLKLTLRVKADAPLGSTTLNLEDNAPSLNRMTLCDGSTAQPTLMDGEVVIEEGSSAAQ